MIAEPCYVDICIGIISTSPFKVLVTESGDFPTDMRFGSIKETIKKLIEKYTGLDVPTGPCGWFSIDQAGIYENPYTKDIILCYAANIPEVVIPLCGAKWVTIEELDNTRPLIKFIINNYASRDQII